MLILETQQQEEAQQYGQKRVNGLIKKPLNPNGKNNGSWAYKVNKWALRKANGPKKSPEKEVVNPWALCDVKK